MTNTRSRTRTTTTAAAVPEAVQWMLDGYGGCCGCSGQCGRTHDRGRCNADELAALTVAPADLAIPPERAAVLPTDELIVWCHRCRDLAQTAARRRRRQRLDDDLENRQLGFWGGVA